MKNTKKRWKMKARRRLFLHLQHEKMKPVDWIVMLAITLVYAVLAFTNLGSLDIPQSFYTTQEAGDEIVVELEQTADISMIKYFTSFGNGVMSIFYSEDGEGYSQLETLSQTDEVDEDGNFIYEQTPVELVHDAIDMYEWQFVNVDTFTAKYIIVRVDVPDIQMLEMAFCGTEGSPVKIASVQDNNQSAMRGNPAAAMFDEQSLVPKMTSYMGEMYFDEVYHVRTAYEQILHMRPYEITHPPLGKTIIGAGIRIFGMNPFGWRVMGALFGVLMLPLMYMLAKRILKKTLYAFIPTFLFAVDFMHFTQTRIATIDSYSVFFIMAMYLFMYIYTEKNYNTQPLHKTLLPLALSGIAFGLGAATKWLCMYAGVGLAVIFFIQVAKRWQEARYARGALRDKSVYENMDESKHKYLMGISRDFKKKTLITLLWCVLFFIIVPAIIYYIAYIPYMKVADAPYDFGRILDNQSYMFKYHTQYVLGSEHPFATEWYEWPIDYRPMWLFKGQGYPEGTMSSMSSFGNPAVWWGGLLSIVALIIIRIKDNRPSKRTMFVAIAALSNYLPWVIVQRETYIYHYFATVPFVILLMGILAKYIIEKYKYGKSFVFAFLGIAVILFAMFYPIISGVPFSRHYCDTFLRWLPTWPFF